MPTLARIQLGTWVKTWSGNVGQVCYRTADGWFGIGIQGERTVTGGQRVDEWPLASLTPLAWGRP